MDELISIIIPIYKAEKFLFKCINSVLVQTYTNFEVILVDDGSPDGSGRICDLYAQKDNRVKVIHKENGGVSSARNAGLDIAYGTYTCFVDSDDYVNQDYLKKMLHFIELDSSELVICSIICHGIIRETRHLCENKCMDIYADKWLAVRLLFNACFYPPWNKLFISRIIHDNGIRFEEGLPYGEDQAFNLEYLKHTSVISTISECLYTYVTGNAGSAVNKYYPDFYHYRLTLLNAKLQYIKENLDVLTVEQNQFINQKIVDNFTYNMLYYLKSSLRNRELYEILRLLTHRINT